MDNKNQKFIIQRIPLRLTIGIIGPREMKNEDNWLESIQNVIKEIVKKHSNEYTELKLCVLSSSAKGTDSFIVKEILSKYPDTLHKMYPYEAEKQTYKDADKFIVNHCDMLIVSEYDKSIKKYAKEKKVYIYTISDKKQNCFKMLKAKIYEFLFYGKFYRKAKSVFIPNSLREKMLKGIDSFNFQIFNKYPSQKDIDSNFDKLLNPTNIPKDLNLSEDIKNLNLSEDIKKAMKKNLIPYRIIASNQAEKYQNEYRNAWLFIVCLAFMSIFIASFSVTFGFNDLKPAFCIIGFFIPVIIFLSCYIKKKGISNYKKLLTFIIIFLVNFSIISFFSGSTPVISVIGFFILVFIFLIYYFNEKVTGAHKKWMEYRFLAELLRSDFYLRICGVNSSYHHKKGIIRGKERWVSIAFEEIISRLSKYNPLSDIKLTAHNYVVKAWIEGQIIYHRKNYEKNYKKSRQFELIRDIVFVLAVTAAFIEFFLYPKSLSHFLTLAALTFPPLVAAIEAVASFMEYKQLSMHSEQMVFELERIKESFNLLTPEKLEKLLNETEHLMIKEVEDWLELVSFAELHTTV